nr:tyrosine-type recombinase/integrase [Adlercreutzia mucosicola]
MEDIRVRHINAWLAAGAGEAGYKLLRQIIRSAIADECYREDVTDPTTRGIRHPRRAKARGEKPALTEREAKALLLGVVGWEYEATVVLGLWLGLRRSEQCGMQWGDIDLRSGLVHVRRGLQRVKGEVVETDIKTHRSARPLMLPSTPRQRLAEIKRLYFPRARKADWVMGPNADPTRYARMLRSHCGRNGLPYVAPKYFRHTFRTLASKAGVPESHIQKMLGHVSLDTTYLYMSLDETILRQDQRQYERHLLKA